MNRSPLKLLQGGFSAALDSVSAPTILPGHLPPPPSGRTWVVGAGKAAAAMAACVESLWPEHRALSGLVVTRHGHGQACGRIEVMEGGHPLPDQDGLHAARRILDLVQSADTDDLVLGLISGGGSSLLTLPSDGLDLADISMTCQALLLSGAPVADINVVRKHVTRTLGGRLGQACKAQGVSLIVSDVVGDDPAVIASGPFAGDPSTYAHALDVLRHWDIHAPDAVIRHLKNGIAGSLAETPKPHDPCFQRIDNHVVASGRTALEGAARYFEAHGITPVIIGDGVHGEARDVAGVFAALAREVRHYGVPWQPPVALLSGGETTVTVRGNGKGGRNSEFLLALALALNGMPDVYALAADTDGIDGSEGNAGAHLAPDTLARAASLDMDGRRYLARNDAYSFFEKLGNLVVTGPTRTNVNDYRVLLIL